MGEERAGAAARFGGSLTVACDIEASRARALADAHSGAVAVQDMRDFDWSSLDAIFVCTPPYARGDIELQIIRAGVPLFVEKPIGVTAAAAAPLFNALENDGVINAVGYMNRYRRSIELAKQMIGQGSVLGISAHWISGHYGVWWRESEELSGGGVNDEATHIIDLMRYLVGEITEVAALRGTKDGIGPSGTVAAILRFQSGALGTLLYSGQSMTKQIALRLHTPSGELRLETWDFNLDYGNRRVSGKPRGTERSIIFRQEVQSFVQAVTRSNRSLVRSTIPDAIRTQGVVDALFKSIRTGQPVSLDHENKQIIVDEPPLQQDLVPSLQYL